MLGEGKDHPAPRVEDTGRRDQPIDRALIRDIPLLLDTIDELRARTWECDPGGLTTDEPGGW